MEPVLLNFTADEDIESFMELLFVFRKKMAKQNDQCIEWPTTHKVYITRINKVSHEKKIRLPSAYATRRTQFPFGQPNTSRTGEILLQYDLFKTFDTRSSRRREWSRIRRGRCPSVVRL